MNLAVQFRWYIIDFIHIVLNTYCIYLYYYLLAIPSGSFTGFSEL